MERVVNPEPIDRTLLLSQHEHKSELLWKGEIPFSSLMRTVRMNDAWNLFRLNRFHERVEEILRRSGLYDVVCVVMMQYDRALVTTMVERWRPETHCFHLPVTTLSPLSSSDITFIMSMDDMPQTPGRKNLLKVHDAYLISM
ncbi:serine/threonine-protein phosphatase 7 long form homolog [Solanum lycopersicum]|uniref:serine/threonine-protein phosphatase 7 long form homolog n=1 Tax=Solanum lycopersicum TaxID=4081 RepID=UPI003747C427